MVTTKKSKKAKQPSLRLFKTIVYILLGIILLAAIAGMLIRHFRHITK
jgi:hypothetical protein